MLPMCSDGEKQLCCRGTPLCHCTQRSNMHWHRNELSGMQCLRFIFDGNNGLYRACIGSQLWQLGHNNGCNLHNKWCEKENVHSMWKRRKRYDSCGTQLCHGTPRCNVPRNRIQLSGMQRLRFVFDGNNGVYRACLVSKLWKLGY